MADISNKTLALVLVAALAVSLVGTLLSMNRLNTLTGFATSTGTSNLTLVSTSAISFAINNVDWGTGSVNASDVTHNYTCTLDTLGTKTGCVNFTTVTQGLVLENTGDTNLNVTLKSDKTPTQFIGTGATFQWKIAENETGSCNGTLGQTTFTTVSTTDTNICTVLLPQIATNSLKIDLNVTIPLAVMSGGAGAKLATLTATGN